MITIERISTKDVAHYEFVENLLITSFPQEERRELEDQRDFTDNNPLFHVRIILDDNKPVGLITYWDFDDFYYIEHFAVSPEARNGGYGKKVLTLLDDHLTKPIVLEVEEPCDEMSIRRVGFYTRMGYQMWERAYLQPPYRKGEGFLPMFIMAKGDLDMEKDFDRVKGRIYKHVYLVEE